MCLWAKFILLLWLLEIWSYYTLLIVLFSIQTTVNSLLSHHMYTHTYMHVYMYICMHVYTDVEIWLKFNIVHNFFQFMLLYCRQSLVHIGRSERKTYLISLLSEIISWFWENSHIFTTLEDEYCSLLYYHFFIGPLALNYIISSLPLLFQVATPVFPICTCFYSHPIFS